MFNAVVFLMTFSGLYGLLSAALGCLEWMHDKLTQDQPWKCWKTYELFFPGTEREHPRSFSGKELRLMVFPDNETS